MAELQYFLVAESYSVDRDTSAISIFNVFSKLTVENIPYNIKQLAAVACLISNQEEINANDESHIEIHVTTPLEPRKEFRGTFQAATRFQNVVLDLANGLNISAPGDVTVELRINGNHVATHTIEVKRKDS